MKKDNSRAKKYANALFQSAVEANQTEKVRETLANLKPFYEKDIMKFFSDPLIDNAVKKNLVKMLFMLIDEHSMSFLPDIEKEYNSKVFRSKNILSAKVVTVNKLETAQVEKIKKSLKQITDKEVSIDEEIDKSIIGGIIIKIGDTIIDGSIKGKINSLSQELMK